MVSMKTKKQEFKKGGFVLLGLFVYAFALVLFLGNKEASVVSSEQDFETEVMAFAENLEYREVRELEKEKTEKENVEVYEEEGEVLGETSVEDFMEFLREFMVGSCDAYLEIDDPQLFCGGSGGGSSGDMKVAQIWAPDIMFLGAAAPYDNLVLTSNPRGSTAFRNASETINPDFDYYIHMPPNPPGGSLLESEILSEEEKKDPFWMHYEAAGSLSEVPFDVHPDEKSKCPDVVNGGEFNVKGGNNLEKELIESFTPPGRMTLGDRDVSARLCREDRVIELDEDESFLLCNEGILQALKECATKFSFLDKCDGVGDLVIDGPLGSGEICNEGDCAIRHVEAGRILSSPPLWTEDLYPQSLSKEEKENDYIVDDPVIITTPCYLRAGCQLCATRCIWDISTWQHHFQQEQMYTYPGFENAMEEDLYWELVEDEIRWRGRIGSSNF